MGRGVLGVDVSVAYGAHYNLHGVICKFDRTKKGNNKLHSYNRTIFHPSAGEVKEST